MHWWSVRWAVVLGALSIVALTLIGRLVPLEPVVGWLGTLGPWGPIALAATFVVTSLLLIPGFVLNVAAGALFGVVVGSMASLVGSTVGALLAFLLARTLARKPLQRWMRQEERVRSLDAAVSRAGFRVVLASRLSPVIPFNSLNYAFGLTRVKFRDFALGSFAGMIPLRVLYASIGSTARSFSGLQESPLHWVLLVAGIAVTIVFLVWTTRLAARAMELPAASAPSEARAAVAKS